MTRSQHKARENVHAQATIGFGFPFHWLKNGARTLNQSLSEVMQNQSNSLITFDTQLKTALSKVIVTHLHLRNVTYNSTSKDYARI